MDQIIGNTNIYPQLDNVMDFRFSDMNRIKWYFTSDIHERETMSKTL